MSKFAIPDCHTFRNMWSGRRTRNEIAALFGVSVVAVSRLAKQYGYPPRTSPKMELRGPMPLRPGSSDPAFLTERPADVVKARAVTAVNGCGAGRWTPEEVAAVLQTQGRYAEMAKLAAKWGVRYLTIQSIWHRARAA